MIKSQHHKKICKGVFLMKRILLTFMLMIVSLSSMPAYSSVTPPKVSTILNILS